MAGETLNGVPIPELLANEQNVPYVMSTISSPVFDSQQRINTLREVHTHLFASEEPLNPALVSPFLRTLHSIPSEKEHVQLNYEAHQMMTGQLLERIMDEASDNRWTGEQYEAALHAYIRFMTMEKLFGEEGARLKRRELMQKAIVARELNRTMAVAARTKKESGGTVSIYLSAVGNETPQVAVQTAILDTCRDYSEEDPEHPVDFVFGPYYRATDVVTNLDPATTYDPNGNLSTIEETIAHQMRKERDPAKGKQLPVHGKSRPDGEVGTLPGSATVGELIYNTVGYGYRTRTQQLWAEGHMYDRYEEGREGRYRDLKLQHPVRRISAAVFGDGAHAHMDRVLDVVDTKRVPTLLVAMNNRFAIGAQLPELLHQNELWQHGHGHNIPGIRIYEDDIEGMYLATRALSRRMAMDGGGAILEIMSERAEAHSDSHGDNDLAPRIEQARLAVLAEVVPGADEQNAELQQYADQLVVPPWQDTKARFKDRLTQLLARAEGKLSPKTVQTLIDVGLGILDPLEEELEAWLIRGDITAEDIMQWKQDAHATMQNLMEEVTDSADIPAELGLQHFTLEPPVVEVQTGSKTYELNIAQAANLALREAMEEHPHGGIVTAVDADKGDTHRDRKIAQLGGYRTELDGLRAQFGRIPDVIGNMPIMERDMVAMLIGAATNSTAHPERDFRATVYGQYAEYIMMAFDAMLERGDTHYLTNGEFVQSLGIITPEGYYVSGIGPRHIGRTSALANQVSGFHIYTATDPEITLKLMRYLLRHERNPYILGLDQRSLLSEKQKFSDENGSMWLPGRGRVLNEQGGRTRIIGIGPGVTDARLALKEMGSDSVDFSIFDPVSLRPFPTADMVNFLTGRNIQGYGEEERADLANGPIVFVSQEAHGTAFAENVRAMFDDPALRDELAHRNVHFIGPVRGVPTVPSDKPQMNAAFPTPADIAQRLHEIGRAA